MAEQQLQGHLNDINNNDGDIIDVIPSPKTRAGKRRCNDNTNNSSCVVVNLESPPPVNTKAPQRAPSAYSSSFSHPASSSSAEPILNNSTPISSPQVQRKMASDTIVISSDEEGPPPTPRRRPVSSQQYLHSEDSTMSNNREKTPSVKSRPVPSSINKRRASPPYKVVKPASKSRKSSPVFTPEKKSRFKEESMDNHISTVAPLIRMDGEDDETRVAKEIREHKEKKRKDKSKDKKGAKARDKDGAVGIGRKTWDRMSSPTKDKENMPGPNDGVEVSEEVTPDKGKSTLSRFGKFVSGSFKQPFGGVKEVKEIQPREKSRSVSSSKEDKKSEKKRRKEKKRKHRKSTTNEENESNTREEQTPARDQSKSRKGDKSNSVFPLKNAKTITKSGNANKHHESNENERSHEFDKDQSESTAKKARASASEGNLRNVPRGVSVPCVIIPSGPSKTPAPEKRSGLGFRMLSKSATKSALGLHSKADKAAVNNEDTPSQEDEKRKKLLQELKVANTERERILAELRKVDGKYAPLNLNVGKNSFPVTPPQKSGQGMGKSVDSEKKLPRPPSVSRGGTPLPEMSHSVRRAKSYAPQSSDSRKRKAIASDIDDDEWYDLKVRQYDNDQDGDYVEQSAAHDEAALRHQPGRTAKQAKRVSQASGFIEPPYIGPRGSSRSRYYGSPDIVTVTPGSRGHEDVPPVPELPNKVSKSAKKKKERREKARGQNGDENEDSGEVKWPPGFF